MLKYDSQCGPSLYEHRGGDECPTHGPNVPHFRLKDSIGPFYCVACAQEVAAKQAAEPPVSAVVAKPINGHPIDLPGNGRADAATIDRLHNELQSAHAAHAIATAEVERLQRMVVGLEAKVAQNAGAAELCAYWREMAEGVRVQRWWDTFNARISNGGTTIEAMTCASSMHGPLEKPEGA